MRLVSLRVLLPVLNLLLALALLRIGHQQMVTQIMLRRQRGGMYEPISGAYEQARYISYALNVPAWAAQVDLPLILHLKGVPWGDPGGYWGAIEDEHDWFYLMFVVLMWYYFGLRLDRLRTARGTKLQTPQWRDRLFRVGMVLYGTFIVSKAFKARDLPGEYESWFVNAAFAWGAVLIATGFFLLLTQRPVRRADADADRASTSTPAGY